MAEIDKQYQDSRVWKYAVAHTTKERKTTVSQEENDLATHVSLCHLRYKQLEDKIDAFNARLVKVETEVSSLKREMASGFSDLKLILEKQNSSKTTQVVATFGTIITAILAFVGYLVTH